MTSPVSLIVPDPAADEARRRGLRRMRSLAVGLLVLAAVVYFLTRDRDGTLGFVNAAAEASMVGAIADWFAVTALFRHPLGIPIPHTALIPRRKDDLGRSLQEFVGENFMAEAVIRERLAAAAPSRRVGDWLADPAHVRRVVGEVAELAVVALGKVRDEHVEDVFATSVAPRFREEPIAPLLGGLLGELVADDLHHGLVDLALTELHRWLAENQETFTEMLTERAPWWAPPKLNEALTGRVHQEALRWLADIRDDPEHHARAALDSMLSQLSTDLLFDPETQQRAELLKERVLEHPAVLATAVSLWNAFRRALLSSLRDPAGAVRIRLHDEITTFAVRLRDDPDLRQRLDGVAADAVVFVVGRYGSELTTVITHTVQQWDGQEAADRIELHVGRDLQFIRINGTIVGGLVGVAIHTVSVLT